MSMSTSLIKRYHAIIFPKTFSTIFFRSVHQCIEKGSRTLPEALKPVKKNGTWRKARLSPRYANRMRKEAIIENKLNKWNEDWEKIGSMRIPKAPLGHKRDRMRQERVEMISKKMKEMPEVLAEYKKLLQSRKRKGTLREMMGLDKAK